jgi:archaellum component FlaC
MSYYGNYPKGSEADRISTDFDQALGDVESSASDLSRAAEDACEIIEGLEEIVKEHELTIEGLQSKKNPEEEILRVLKNILLYVSEAIKIWEPEDGKGEPQKTDKQE